MVRSIAKHKTNDTIGNKSSRCLSIILDVPCSTHHIIVNKFGFYGPSLCFCLLTCLLLLSVLEASSPSAPVLSEDQSGSNSVSSSMFDAKRNGPHFLIEPPGRVVFLNSTGAVISCKVGGTPPLRVWWSHGSDGQPVTDIAGLRQVRANGDLVLSPFSPQVLQQDVHSTVYRCMATNSIGTIRSRDCQVRAVIHQTYSVQVYGEYAISGNTGHLKCQIPAFVREHVIVTAWLRADTILATYLTPKDSRFLILSNGDLLIRNASRQDSGYYRCQTRHELSQQTVVSSIEGHFIVNDVISGVSPRISSQSPVKVLLGQSAELVCVTKAWPQATIRWFQASESGLITPVYPSNNVHIYDSLLYIRHTSEQHSGNWICMANNTLGEERAYIELYVSQPTRVHMIPDYLVADMNSQATFVCNVSTGSAAVAPLSILWVKDGQPILLNTAQSPISNSAPSTNGYGQSRIRLIEPHVLNIRRVQREDQGCYQCIVQTDDTMQSTEQASAQLKLGDSPPVLVDTFTDGLVLEQGAQISLKCSATSTLLPQIRWSLDGQPIDGYAPRRVTMADYVKDNGHVVSFVNVTNAKVIDGGEYECRASNSAGMVTYSGRVNIIGSASLRPNWIGSKADQQPTLTVISGQSVELICPVKAYPIESIVWQHRSATLPNNHRHNIEPVLSGVGGKLTIVNVHRDNDQGQYDCTVKGSDGKSVRGSLQMTVRVAPLIDGQLISPITTANQGMKVKLMCSVLEGDPPLKIKWYRQSDMFNPINTNHALGITVQQQEDYSLLTFRSVSIRNMGNWTCRASNDVLSVNRTTFLIVNVAPSWRTEPKNTQVVLGNSVQFNCQAEGHPTPRLIWKKSVTMTNAANANGDLEYSPDLIDLTSNNDNTQSTSSSQQQPSEYRELLSTYRRQVYPNGTLFIQQADKSDSAFYMCQVSNGIGAGLSKVIQLTVHSPPFFATKFLSKSVSKGETALLDCEVEGDPVLHIKWHKDRSIILQQAPSAANTNNTTGTYNFYDKRYSIKQDLISAQKVISFLQIVNVQREDSTIYTCIAKNNFGSDNTSVQLIVQEVPDAPQSVEVIEVSSRSVQLQWKSPYSGNSALIKFYVHYRQLNCTYLPVATVNTDEESSFWNEASTKSANELRMTVNGLLPNCYYQMKLQSQNQIGRSEMTKTPIIIKTLEEVPGGPPTDVQVETTSSTSLKIKWRPPLRAVQFGRIRGYYIGYKVATSDEPFQYKNVDAILNNNNPSTSTGTGDETLMSMLNSDSHQVSYITNLKRKTTYVIILQAYNSVGPGPRSDEIKISTFDSQPPTSPLLEVVSTTYDGILLKWDSSFQHPSGRPDLTVDDDFEKREYIVYFREDFKPQTETWHQKKIFSKNNQFVLNKENTQGKIRCGTKYHLYMIATNSLGTGEPSETVIARTKGDSPIAPNAQQFIIANSTTAILALKSWQTRGCPILAFTIQYKPIHQKQWIPLVEYFESRDYFYVSHLSANRDYQLLVSAHSEPGVTRQEYTFHTANSSSVVRLHPGATSASSSPMDPYRTIDSSILHQSTAASSLHFRNLTVLLPVLISLMVLIVILGTLFACLRRQHVNHVVNSVDALTNSMTVRPHSDLCVEHLTRYGAAGVNGKEATAQLLLSRRTSQEFYPMTEFNSCQLSGGTSVLMTGASGPTTTCPSNSSCDSKSNLLNGNLATNGGTDLIFATSPRHHISSTNNQTSNALHFATLNCNNNQMKHIIQQQQLSDQPPMSEQSYYSSPQRTKRNQLHHLKNNQTQQTIIHRSEHEYAEPLQSIHRNQRSIAATASIESTNLLQLTQTSAQDSQESVIVGQDNLTIQTLAPNTVTSTSESYSTLNNQSTLVNNCLPYL